MKGNVKLPLNVSNDCTCDSKRKWSVRLVSKIAYLLVERKSIRKTYDKFVNDAYFREAKYTTSPFTDVRSMYMGLV